MADAVFFEASFGGVDLLISEIETDGGRDVAVQSPSRGDKHVLQDRGKRLKSTQATILFIDQPGKPAFTLRYKQLVDLVDLGEASVFTHPLVGTYAARISEMRTRANADTKQIEVQCTILAEDEPTTVFPIGAGTAPAAGLEAVTTAAAAVDGALGALGLPATPITAASISAVTSWSAADVLDSNAVFGAFASLTQQISNAIDTYELATDLQRWSAYQAMINLSFQVTRAGDAFTASSGQLFQITVARARPLLAICADIYGAAAAQDNASQVAQINRVRTPGLVPVGTVLKMPPVRSST